MAESRDCFLSIPLTRTMEQVISYRHQAADVEVSAFDNAESFDDDGF